ncbi:MAG: phosphatidate cytidylyltransferase [Actinomycetes bacterium]
MSEPTSPDGGATASSSGRNLPVAIGVGVVLAAVFLGSLFTDARAFVGVIALLSVVGVIETGQTFREIGRPLAVPVLLVAIPVMLVGAYRAGTAGLMVGVVVLLAGAVAWELAAHARDRVLDTLGTTVFLGLWIGFLASFAVLLLTRPVDGQVAVLAVCGGAIFGDIGGFVFGSWLGKHRIAPTVSPNKTWEGLVGSVVTSAVLGAIVLPQVGTLFSSPWVAAGVAGIAAVGGFLGDLTESMLKRDLGVKDLGRVLPGHGGVLDRVDGILVALPLGYYLLALTA